MTIYDSPKRNGPRAPGGARGKQRRQELVEAAYFVLAEKGFEGLRTREVAKRVGINIATLHYYFPSKEALISGVVEHLLQILRQPEVPVPASATAVERLRAEFADISVRVAKSPEQLKVLTELAVRAWRDPSIARILSYLDAAWQGHLESIFRDGIKEKSFRQDLDVKATAAAMMSQLRGLGYQKNLKASALKTLVTLISQQIERWVRPSEDQGEGAKKRR
jgi:TetR/AcrR family transcriptional regulator, regulator of cefoperazone and chloramphenicol sensitivity